MQKTPALGLATAATPAISSAKPVRLISSDGLRRDDVLHAQARGGHLPDLDGRFQTLPPGAPRASFVTAAVRL